MVLFRNAEWNSEDLPDLSFQNYVGPVDIGFLGGEEHRQAFALIFTKMLTDNQSVLAR